MSTISERERAFEHYINSHQFYNRACCDEPAGIGPIPNLTPGFHNVSVANVAIDTRRLTNPKVLLTFTCSISSPVGIDVNLNFIIVKTIYHTEPSAIGGPYTFSKTVSSAETESFCFQCCECNPSACNATYLILLSPNSLIEEKTGLAITNIALTALAVETL